MLPRSLFFAACLACGAPAAMAQDQTQNPNPGPTGALNASVVLPGAAAAMALLILSEMGGKTVENPGTGGNDTSAPGSF